MTSPSRPAGMTLDDYVTELTRTHDHVEHYTTRERGEWHPRNHHVRSPSLLAQLWAGDVPNQADAGGGARSAPDSRPPTRLEALDAAARIDLEANRWYLDLTGERPAHLDTAVLVVKIGALAASADHTQRKAITKAVRGWWITARIITGWDSPAWTPDATCPQCGKRGTLRIRLAERVGMCTDDACRTMWDEASIGLLADHIRAESAQARRAAPGRGPCWCPLPEPRVSDLRFTCPACGSARCRHALAARLLAELRDQEQRLAQLRDDERMGA